MLLCQESDQGLGEKLESAPLVPLITTKILINLTPIRPFLRAAFSNLKSKIFNLAMKKAAALTTSH
jgi:hypothetical protein